MNHTQLKKVPEFFYHLEQGLQAYFDKYDREFGGIIHLTVGVKVGKVGGIIKGDSMLRYDGFTTERVREILAYVLPTYMKRTVVPYAIEEVIDELTGKCRHAECPEQPAEEEQPSEQPAAEELPIEQPKPKRKYVRKRKATPTDNEHADAV